MGNSIESYHPNIDVGVSGNVVTVTLDSPDTRNACTGDMFVAIGETFRDISYSGARAVVLTGAGGEFCSGADLSGLGGAPPHEAPADPPAAADGGGPSAPDEALLEPPRSMVAGMRVLADVVQAVHDCSVPVVARVDGLCVGAGLGLALAADMLWCSERARFCAIFAKRGLSMDFGSSWLLRQRVGVAKAKELAFTARMVGAAEAVELRLANAAVPVEDLDSAVDEVVAAIVGGPPIALSLIKRQIDNASTVSLSAALEAETLAQSVNVRTKDMSEALMAWVERRTPEFRGR